MLRLHAYSSNKTYIEDNLACSSCLFHKLQYTCHNKCGKIDFYFWRKSINNCYNEQRNDLCHIQSDVKWHKSGHMILAITVASRSVFSNSMQVLLNCLSWLILHSHQWLRFFLIYNKNLVLENMLLGSISKSEKSSAISLTTFVCWKLLKSSGCSVMGTSTAILQANENCKVLYYGSEDFPKAMLQPLLNRYKIQRHSTTRITTGSTGYLTHGARQYTQYSCKWMESAYDKHKTT